MQSTQKTATYQLAITGLMAAVMCILGPVSVPIGAVPISLTNLIVLFSVMLLGAKYGTISCIVYLALGAVGLPVFSGWQGGIAKLAGPTGGYLVGFVLMALVSGLIMEKSGCRKLPTVLGMILGVLLDYLLGTMWFILTTKSGLGAALWTCVFPFLPGDGLKIGLAVVFGSMLRRRLTEVGVLKAEKKG